MRIDIITGFPGILEEPLQQSIIKKGREAGAVSITVHNLRDYADDRHKTIDDYPYGGGPGMVLKVEPFDRCLQKIAGENDLNAARIMMMTPRGRTFDQKKATELSLDEHLIFLCGHYKGVDERLYSLYKIEDVSIGDFVLSSGEIAALVITDSIVRLLPNVLKDIDSAWSDSFQEGWLDAPYYTRPETYRHLRVPEVLTSGHHERIENWRNEKRMELTKKLRPDLLKKINE
ncbi:MAG TPA: tRNA (guanosine(37)-N1)-methyltransferase TrmD [Caldithrix abyssi]|uniref:tRNA (guanine-N(1)-)-methyltransferase n=1 Tax=Caldithrix abyssi TaxID=187145 RepID=A0A7V1PVP3_CALAY|nr:tRNA (guanosine(37)-N1)-methyltransferase TrmD [Caldithrix abyssi]